MRISFHGAAGEVTGSCYLVETDRARVLVDFGQHQGGAQEEVHNRVLPPINPGTLHAVVLTHAHIDHSGRLPLLVKSDIGGTFAGRVFATPATCELVKLLLEDTAHLQEADAERAARKHAYRTGNGARQTSPDERAEADARRQMEETPLFREQDVAPLLARLSAVEYDKAKEVAPGVTIRFTDAGHILGSASIEMTLVDKGQKRVVVFSGDVGPRGAPLLKDPVPPQSMGVVPDVVIHESTYGDRDHRSQSDTVEELATILRESIWEKEKVLMPAFAVGRSQSLLYHIGELKRSNRVPAFPVYLDSPMASDATRLYEKFMHLMDGDTQSLLRKGHEPLDITGLVCVCTGMESRQLNDQHGAMVVIAGSGMCNGGRILHHLMHNVYKRDTRVVITGYQSVGTLGRRLVEGASEVRIFGETIPVRAKVHTLGGFSAHAGQTELLDWARVWKPPAGKAWPRLVLTHGENQPRAILAGKIEQEMGWKAAQPMMGDSIEL